MGSSTVLPKPDARTSLDSPSPVWPRVRPERSVMPTPRLMPPSCTPDIPVTTDTDLDMPVTTDTDLDMPVTTATPTALALDVTTLPVSPCPVPERGVMLMRRTPLPPLPWPMLDTPSVLD